VLCVLHSSSLTQAEQIFRFFWELGPTEVGFNLEESEAAHPKGGLDFAEAKDLSRQFFKRYWDIAERYGFPHEVREFRHIGNVIAGVLAGRRLFNEMVEPISCVTISTGGGFSTFAPELSEPGSQSGASVILGNIMHDDVGEMLRSEHFQQMYRDILTGVAECESSCFYFPFCGGGSPSNKMYELGSLQGTETFYCRNSIQPVVDEALERLAKPVMYSAS
jgi:uncharacterized protein